MDEVAAGDPAGLLTLSVRRLSPQTRVSLRAAFCLRVPLLVGLLVHQRAYGTTVAIGTLWRSAKTGWIAGETARCACWVWRSQGAWAWRLVRSSWRTSLRGGLYWFSTERRLSSQASLRRRFGQRRGCICSSDRFLGGGLTFSGRIWQSSLAIVVGAL
jgi:hypothetical protein